MHAASTVVPRIAAHASARGSSGPRPAASHAATSVASSSVHPTIDVTALVNTLLHARSTTLQVILPACGPLEQSHAVPK